MRPSQVAFEKWRNRLLLVRGRLRARLLAWRGATVAQKSYIGAGCKIDRPWCIRIGKRFYAEEFTYLKMVADNALLEFGDFVFVGRGSQFDVINRITVGDHTVIAPGCFITDHNHGIDPDQRVDEQSCTAKPVIIGKAVWIGTKVVVLPGVEIGDGAVIAANAVVTSNVPPMAVVAGTPAKLLYYRGNRSSVGASGLA